MEDAKQITKAETVSSAALWYGVLAGPIVWACQLLLNYGLEEGVACTPGSRFDGKFFNVSISTVIQITNAVATVLTMLAFTLSYRCYRRLRGSDTTVAQRAGWMAVAGMFVSGLFLLITALKFASPVFLKPCTFLL